MSLTPAPLSIAGNTVGTFVPAVRHRLKQLSTQLRNYFGASFCLRDGSTGEILMAPEGTCAGDDDFLASLSPIVDRQRSMTVVAETDGCVIIALPLKDGGNELVATGAFRLATGTSAPNFTRIGQTLAVSAEKAQDWFHQQQEWTLPALERMASVVGGKFSADTEIERLTVEIDKVSDSLSSTYEEISLLYGLTQNLRISSSNSQLGDLALNWLLEVIPCRGLAILFQNPDAQSRHNEGSSLTSELHQLTAGQCPADAQSLAHLIRYLNLNEKRSAFVANQRVTERNDWPFHAIRQIIAVPLVESDNIFGWLFALNHSEDKGFGTVEASLLSSVGTILGIHSGNIELYRKQSEFVTSVVRALTSAIDAKDPYTCGHSDRVARLAVRLAQEMGHDTQTLNLLYMAGLLHDVGKIGIDDSVLRKPGRLTDEEYERIKMHPELGCNILSGLKQLEDVLPVVLHHHEQWDGKGYPHGLAGEAIPQLARITAVADAYDAMSSDRPYRKGMPAERVNAIFREGSGTQWDPEVVAAFFATRDDISDIMSEERAELGFDVGNWIK